MKKLSSELIVDNKWLKLHKHRVSYGNTESDYYFFEKFDAVMILPLLEEKNKLFTYLVKQLRYPTGKSFWQFPGGGIEKDKDPQTQAKEELLQETGLLFESYIPLHTFYVDPGFSTQKCSVFVAENFISQESRTLEETERDMQVKKFSLQEINALLMSDEAKDTWLLSSLYLLENYLRKTHPTLA